MSKIHVDEDFDPIKTREIISDLFEVKPWIYWADFLLSVGFGWFFFGVSVKARLGSFSNIAAFILCCILLYRAVIFIHEIAHRTTSGVKGFETVWNLLSGIPSLTPSHMYRGVHLEHHRKSVYGTDHDGEYLPFGLKMGALVRFSLQTLLLLPTLFVVRYLILGPISFLHPKLREIVIRRTSSLVVDSSYIRTIPKGDEWRQWLWQEIACIVYVWAVFIGLCTGYVPLRFVGTWYVLGLVVWALNSFRTLVAHRYENPGHEMTLAGQLKDSVNLTGNVVLQEMMAPIGLRFHALHHLFVNLPYHSLPEAHRRLMVQLPAGSPYHVAEEKSAWGAFFKLFRHAHHARVS